jgi:spermidine/putrescine transport system ATP-binding protein
MTESSPRQPGSGADLNLINVTKSFGDFVAVDDLSLTIPSGSFFALLGPSGCGKTTTLRMVAGLEEPTSGQILIGSEDVTYAKPYKRPVNTVFQSYALFPHLDIFENVAFGLRRRHVKDVKGQVEDILELTELTPLARRKPNQLSGGQQQRVALARALINRPAVLLLDEPLGALDLKLRRQMQLELKGIQNEVGLTFVHVTHDQEEAMTMADTIAVMNEGRVEQLGAPVDLYENPRTTFVANFLGQSNFFDATLSDRSAKVVTATVQGQRLGVPASRVYSPGDDVHLGVRPEKLTLSIQGDDSIPEGHNRLTGIVADSSFIGVSTEYRVEMAWGMQVTVFEQNVHHDIRIVPGASVVLSWDPANTFALDASQSVEAGIDSEVLDAVVGAPA